MNTYYVYVTSKGNLQVTKRADGAGGTLKQGLGGAIYGHVMANTLLEAVQILFAQFPHLAGKEPQQKEAKP